MVLQSAKSTDFLIKCEKSTDFWNIWAGCSKNLVYHNFSLQKAINVQKYVRLLKSKLLKNLLKGKLLQM